MKLIKHWLSALAIGLSLSPAFSQESFIVTGFAQDGYIVTDSTMQAGVNLIKSTSFDNAHFIRLKTKEKTIVYLSPKDIKEYGLKDGTVYVAKNIPISGSDRTVFLKRLAQGKINLYAYQGKGFKLYFVEQDSTALIELSGDKGSSAYYKNTINRLSDDSDWMNASLRRTRFKAMSLTKAVSYYNSGKMRPFPYSKFGVLTGLNRTSLVIPAEIDLQYMPSAELRSDISHVELNYISPGPSSSPILGFYADMPLGFTDFSIVTGVNISKQRFSANARTSYSDVDMVINLSSLDVPLLLRYTLPAAKISPFVNLGGNFTYHYKESNTIYRANFHNGMTTIKQPLTAEISPLKFGYSLGAGLHYRVKNNHSVSAELRYGQLYDRNGSFDLNCLNFLLGLSF